MRTRWYYGRAVLAGMILFLAALLTLGSCDDNDEGPSTRDLLIGSWELVEAEVDGVSVDLDDVRLDVEFQSDGDYRETLTEEGVTETYYGEWELSGNEVELEYDDGDFWELEILSVTGDELRVEDDDNFEGTFERDN